MRATKTLTSSHGSSPKTDSPSGGHLRTSCGGTSAPRAAEPPHLVRRSLPTSCDGASPLFATPSYQRPLRSLIPDPFTPAPLRSRCPHVGNSGDGAVSPPDPGAVELAPRRSPEFPTSGNPGATNVENSGDRRSARWRRTQQRPADLRSPEFPTSCHLASTHVENSGDGAVSPPGSGAVTPATRRSPEFSTAGRGRGRG